MPTVTAEIRQLSKLDADTLADLYCTGRIDEDTLAAIDAADVRAKQAKAKRDAQRQEQRSAWYEAAYAQYQASMDFTKGNMFSRFALDEQERRKLRLIAAGKPAPPESDGMVLWTCSDEWAEKRASWELQRFWEDNGGRLSLARWQREQAAQARAERDRRDLERMEAQAAAKPRPSARDLAIAAAMRPAAPAARPEGSIAGMIRALGHLTRAVETNTSAWERAVARVNGGKQA